MDDYIICVMEGKYPRELDITDRENASRDARYYRSIYPGKGKVKVFESWEEYHAALAVFEEEYWVA